MPQHTDAWEDGDAGTAHNHIARPLLSRGLLQVCLVTPQSIAIENPTTRTALHSELSCRLQACSRPPGVLARGDHKPRGVHQRQGAYKSSQAIACNLNISARGPCALPKSARAPHTAHSLRPVPEPFCS